jgi:hypothetical protein
MGAIGLTSVFDFVLRPVRSVTRVLNEDALKPVEETERETLDAVRAIDRATQSIERHVEVIETLATSVGPLAASVDRLNETMRELVEVLAPLAGAERGFERAEHGAEHVERVFGFRRHTHPDEPEADAPAD